MYWNRLVAASYAAKYYNTCSGDPENSAATNPATSNGRERDTLVYSSLREQDDCQVRISNMPSQCAHAGAIASLGRWTESSA